MKIIVSELDDWRGKRLYTDVTTVEVNELSEEAIYYAMRDVYGFSAEYMDQASISVGKRVAVVAWDGIEFNMVRDADLPMAQ